MNRQKNELEQWVRGSRAEKGSSLLSVLLASSVGIVIALALATLMSSLQMNSNSIKFRSDGDVLTDEMRATLASRTACLNTFGGLTATTTSNHNVTRIYDGSAAPGVAMYSVGSTYGDQTLKLNAMTLNNFQAGGVPNVAVMTFTAYFDSAKKVIGAQQVHRSINISIEYDAANLITSCIALSKMSDGIWQRTPTNPNNIFYSSGSSLPSDGKVGINTSNPRTKLQVNGSFMIGEFATGTYSADGLAPKLLFGGNTDDNTDSIYFQRNNYALDKSELRLVIGDNYQNAVANDQFTIGALDYANSLAYVPYFTLDSTFGYVGLGISNPVYRLDVSSDINSATGLRVGGVRVCTNTGCTAASDQRLKENIRPLNNSLDKILSLQGVEYSWINKEKFGSDRQIGLIAQDVEKVYPEVVVTDPQAGTKSIAYDHLIAPAIEAIKALFEVQSRDMDSLQKQLSTLKSENARQEKELTLLRNRLERLERQSTQK